MGARFYKENQYIDQFISTFDFVVDLETSGISSTIVDYCDETYGSANPNWHFKHLDKDTSKVFVSFKNENGNRMVINSSTVKVYDSSGTLRVTLGDLS